VPTDLAPRAATQVVLSLAEAEAVRAAMHVALLDGTPPPRHHLALRGLSATQHQHHHPPEVHSECASWS
jgi:hypothetical protein